MAYEGITTIVVDESVPAPELDRALGLVRQRGVIEPALIYIQERFPGLADSRILASLLSPSTALITKDRPFHNTVLSRGYRSIYVQGTTVTDRPLRGIQPSELPPARAEELEEGLYHPPEVPLRRHLMPGSQRELKKLSTRRRRIRNHFGGLQNLSELALTVSWLPASGGILVGVRLRAISNRGLKALDASESYLFETIAAVDAASASLCHGLIIPVQLMLDSVPTKVFYDGNCIAVPEVSPDYQQAFSHLRDCYARLSFEASYKGFFIERLQRKLRDLAGGRSNETKSGYLAAVLCALAASSAD
ncbi:MAG: hypothetical protein HY319_03295 [Armatimonadetes bacterium]|nr:hypothetical protein [Armatimonadota bacterium]